MKKTIKPIKLSIYKPRYIKLIKFFSSDFYKKIYKREEKFMNRALNLPTSESNRKLLLITYHKLSCAIYDCNERNQIKFIRCFCNIASILPISVKQSVLLLLDFRSVMNAFFENNDDNENFANVLRTKILNVRNEFKNSKLTLREIVKLVEKLK